ncbi:MAG: lamin tail domain-containing protein, partial [Planctomycetota bacterium]|nr:lamin tail domain-containing protein [Planctomycetota bacterium]
DYDDWIEIYNYGEDAIDIGGMWMTDNIDTGPAWQIPRGNPALTTIASHGYLSIWADNQTGQGVLHVSFALSGTGEDIGLYDADRNLIDSIQFGPQEQNKSYGQLPDANDHWQVFDYPTPGKSNQSAPVAVIINEIMYHPYHALNTPENMGQEYIELYNKGNAPVNLSGWRFSDGVEFVFPNVTLNNGNYLVVAADVNAFKAKYPGVTNVVGGWQGRLSNSGENIVLSDNLGMVIDRVHYADEGDWAVRELGPVDHSHRGWQWSDQTDGGGRSLGLINPNMPNEYGQNWTASSVSDGTPGRVNSVVNNNIAPLILDVEHFPIIPGPNDQVTVTARVIDEQATGVSVTLHYRLDGQPNFTALPMLDDGVHGDGLAGNGVYGARIPAHPDKTIIEFFVEARDAASNTRTWPAPSMVDGVPQQVTNLLYQVDQTFDPNAPWAPDRQPIYYVIMTEKERAELALIGSRSNGEEDSDATMNGTFISIDGTSMEFCYNAGVRNRGHGTRTGPPNNYHVDFPNDRPWKDVGAISFNCRYTHAQIIGSAIFCMANIVAPDTTPVQLRINGANLAYQGSPMYGVYVRLEAFNDDFRLECAGRATIRRHQPQHVPEPLFQGKQRSRG